MRISVIIPCYNVQDTIRRCLDSVLNQSHSVYEVICVDDCSTDETLSILRSYGASIRVIEHRENKGVGVTRRDGVNASTGDYVFFVDPDDWLEPNALEILVEALDGGDIVTGCVDSGPLSGIDAQREFLHSKTTFLCDRLIKRTLFDQEPITDLRYFEDLEVMPRLLFRARKVTYTKETGYHHTKDNPNSLTTNASQIKHLVYKALVYLNMCLYFLDNQPGWLIELDLPGLLLTDLLTLYVKAKLDPEEFNRYDAETTEICNLLTILLVQAQQ